MSLERTRPRTPQGVDALMQKVEANLREFTKRTSLETISDDLFFIEHTAQRIACSKSHDGTYIEFAQHAQQPALRHIQKSLEKAFAGNNYLRYCTLDHPRSGGYEAKYGFALVANSPRSLVTGLNSIFPPDLHINIRQYLPPEGIRAANVIASRANNAHQR